MIKLHSEGVEIDPVEDRTCESQNQDSGQAEQETQTGAVVAAERCDRGVVRRDEHRLDHQHVVVQGYDRVQQGYEDQHIEKNPAKGGIPAREKMASIITIASFGFVL